MTGLRVRKAVAGIGLSAVLAASLAAPASALPLGASGVRTAGTAVVEQVGCRGCWVGAGVAAGVLAGAAIAGAASRPYYYYDAPPVVYYAPPPPVYYAPPPPRYRERCWVQTGPYRGQGYWGRC